MKEELNPTKRKAHNEIISNFSNKTKFVYCVIGFEHIEIMDSLEIDYLILCDKNSLTYISQANLNQLKEDLKDKNLIFLTSNVEDYLCFLKQCKEQLQKSFLNLYCFDLEVLKAIELIPGEELSQNDYLIGLKLPFKCTFKGYIDEVISESRNDGKELYKYIKSVLEIERNRQIEGIYTL